jgi:hypothetical protein
MKVKLTKDERLVVTPETVAESIALKYLFNNATTTAKWAESIIIDSTIPPTDLG